MDFTPFFHAHAVLTSLPTVTLHTWSFDTNQKHFLPKKFKRAKTTIYHFLYVTQSYMKDIYQQKI